MAKKVIATDVAAEETYISGEKHKALQAEKKNAASFGSSRTIALVVAAVALMGMSFIAGMHYQKDHQTMAVGLTNTQNGTNSPALGAGGFGARRGLRRSTLGSVTAISPTSITIQNQSGTSTTLAITSTTMVTNNGQTAAVSDIQVGNSVAVIADPTNSTQAARIILNPQFGTNAPAAPSPNSSTPAPTDTQLN